MVAFLIVAICLLCNIRLHIYAKQSRGKLNDSSRPFTLQSTHHELAMLQKEKEVQAFLLILSKDASSEHICPDFRLFSATMQATDVLIATRSMFLPTPRIEEIKC